MKQLKTIINSELKGNENICITTQSKLDNLNDSEWYKFDEYSLSEIYNVYKGTELVKRFWHENGLCIVLNS